MRKIVLLLFALIISGCSFLLDDDSVNPYADQEEAGLPVFYIHPKPVSKDFYTPVTVIYRGHEYEAEGKIRGDASAYKPKKGYTIRFSDDDLFNDSTLGNAGFSDRSKILLLADFDDNSHLRNRLAQNMWAMLQDEGDGTYKSPVIQTDSAVVYLNGDYEGLYTIIESVDENYLTRCASGEVNPLSSGLSAGGDLFKSVDHDADFYISDEMEAGFEKKSGYPEMGVEGAYDDLIDFIYYINESSDSELTDSESGFESRASLDSYYGWWFFTTFLRATDSMAKNTYHYYESDGLWYYFPWDFNASFGQSANTGLLDAEFSDEYVSSNGIANRIVELSTFEEEYSTLYTDLLADGGNWDLDTLLAEVDEIWAEIEDAANDDWVEWGDTFIDEWDNRDNYNTPQEEVEYIKEWIEEVHSQAQTYFTE
ncbi:MAG: CotH kinase family protein [Spirochaetales bacterium]|nr:CotH kinase family protein [Spirochaetales bacterium]